ncbi:MAG: hypothetical protein SFV54_02485 [Bryobacteraceae bacterium]|nr:hypothetical protein [Bryobacteraceae bacterium]
MTHRSHPQIDASCSWHHSPPTRPAIGDAGLDDRPPPSAVRGAGAWHPKPRHPRVPSTARFLAVPAVTELLAYAALALELPFSYGSAASSSSLLRGPQTRET